MDGSLPWHPRLVHFPIALLLTGSAAALAYLLGWRRASLASLAWATLTLGWVAIFPAVLSGLVDQSRFTVPAAAQDVISLHIASGLALIVVYGLALYERLRSPAALDLASRRAWLILVLAVGVALLVASSALGGRLVYEFEVGVRP
ncbi:MAG: DUF2231 domain-containing protein [Caldilineales bacterium]|nr:DUF2231 domain-containing protein [Caldilineales bacterium]MDW8316808.1 DUF2231 domain-containing protein [Anaerolineae bacterium]